MEWSEYIKKANWDEADERAVDAYKEYLKLWNDETVPRLDMIKQGFDPEVINEFCLYPIDKWDRLINWAKTFYSDEEAAFAEKMNRAVLIKYRIDPAGIECLDNEAFTKRQHDLQEDIESDEVKRIPITSWWEGSVIKDVYNSMLETCQDNSLTMEDVSFKFNSITSGVVARNNKDMGNNAPVRKTVCFQKNVSSALNDEYERSTIFNILNVKEDN